MVLIHPNQPISLHKNNPSASRSFSMNRKGRNTSARSRPMLSKEHAEAINRLMRTIDPNFSAEGYELWIDGSWIFKKKWKN